MAAEMDDTRRNPAIDDEWLDRFREALRLRGHGIKGVLTDKLGFKSQAIISRLQNGDGSLDNAFRASFELEILPPLGCFRWDYREVIEAAHEAFEKNVSPHMVVQSIKLVRNAATSKIPRTIPKDK